MDELDRALRLLAKHLPPEALDQLDGPDQEAYLNWLES